MNRRNFLKAIGVAVVAPLIVAAKPEQAVMTFTDGQSCKLQIIHEYCNRDIRQTEKMFRFASNYGMGTMRLKEALGRDYKEIEIEFLARYDNEELRKLRKRKMLS